MSSFAPTLKPVTGNVTDQSRNTLQRAYACIAGVLLMLGYASLAVAAGFTVENSDRNKLIEILDVLNGQGKAAVLYSTRPQRDQAHQSERCSLNVYLLELQRGLVVSRPVTVAENYCASVFTEAKLLSNGDVLLVAGDEVETWRPGNGKISQWSLGALDALAGKWSRVNESGAFIIADDAGQLVFTRNYHRKRGDKTSSSGLVAGFDSEGKIRWRLELHEPGVLLGIIDAWATPDGGALLHLVAHSMDDGAAIPGTEAPAGSMSISQNRLYRVLANGEMAAPIVIASFQMIDFSNPAAVPDMATDPEGFQAFLEGAGEQDKAAAWAAGDVVARPGTGDVMDVVLGAQSREARLLRIGRGGQVLLDADLTHIIEEEGLPRWVDFSSDTSRIFIFGSLGTRRNRLPQGYVSRIELPSGPALTRLAPLKEPGLKEAQAAGDEDRQYLEHNPSHQPQRVAMLADTPVTISLVWRSRRQAIQIDEIERQSVVYTEARDERRAAQAKEAKRAQRKADREAGKQSINREMAAAIGVSDEEYAAMSNSERKEAMVRSGDMAALMAAANQQAAAAMQQMQAQQSASGAAMTPEMTAALAQAQQAMASAGMTVPGVPSVSGNIQPAVKHGEVNDSTTGSMPENSVPLDVNLHGTIEYEHPDGSATTLVILDRQSGKELLRKYYADGSVYEYLDFGHYQLPLDRIGVILSDDSVGQLRDLTPIKVE